VSRPPAPRYGDYVQFLPIQTRWMDNDVYGHVNNVVYYAYFDTAINRWLVTEGGLDIQHGEAIGLCVTSQCEYLAPASYPEELEAGIRVEKLGRSSVRYEIGIFKRAVGEGVGAGELCAHGHFVHVFVDRVTRRPLPIPDRLRSALARLVR
jgi:acyl-CoA thioester hydrolase